MKFLVTGATGFVGSAIAKALIVRGDSVVGIARREAKFSFPYIRKDLSELTPEDLAPFLPIDGVFHTAAKVGMWGPWSDFQKTNVDSTQRLVAIAQALKIPRFVYTSSPSVIANGKDLKNVDERQPYPEKFHANYPRSKSLAEKIVLRANSNDFKTLSLRPHLIFGPGDSNLIPTILKKALDGRLKIIGQGKNLCDFSFIEDCVNAHLLAMNALSDNSNAAGRAYFISQGDPYPLWDFINQILIANNVAPITKRVSASIALPLASLIEKVSLVLNKEPPLTRFLVEEMSTDHYFDISAAKKELKYTPRYSVSDGIKATFSNNEALCANE